MPEPAVCGEAAGGVAGGHGGAQPGQQPPDTGEVHPAVVHDGVTLVRQPERLKYSSQPGTGRAAYLAGGADRDVLGEAGLPDRLPVDVDVAVPVWPRLYSHCSPVKSASVITCVWVRPRVWNSSCSIRPCPAPAVLTGQPHPHSHQIIFTNLNFIDFICSR